MLGEQRSRVISLEIQVPWETPAWRFPLTKYLRAFVDRKEAEGWRFERVLNQRREPFANIHKERGILAVVYVIDCVFSRRIQEHTFYVPDRAVPKLLANPRIKRIITDIT